MIGALIVLVLQAPHGGAVLEIQARHACASAHRVSRELDRVPESERVCLAVAREALAQGFALPDVAMVLATAYNESRFRTHGGSCANVIDRGYGCEGQDTEVGPLQIKPRWWCPDRSRAKCNPVRDGVGALGYLLENPRRAAGDWTAALAEYNGGLRSPDYRYADRVYNIGRRIRAAMRRGS